MRFWSLNTRFSVSRQVSGFHPYIGFLTALIASALLITPLSSRSSCLRQPILWLSHRLLLLRQSHSQGIRLTPAPRLWRTLVRYSVPELRLTLRLGSHSSPGYLWNAFRIRNEAVRPFTVPILDPADNPSRLVTPDDDSDVSSSPTHLQLCSTGFVVGFCVTAFHSRFTD